MPTVFGSVVIEDTLEVNGQNIDQTNASNITSGTLNNARLSANLSQLGDLTFTTNDFIQHNGTTLTNVTPTQVKTSIGLSNVVNSLQVINAGGGTSFASGLLSARPTASVNGRFFITTDSGPYFDNGSNWVPVQAPITGDISIDANDNIATLPTINPSVGTYNNLTVNSKGQVTGGSNVNYLNDSSGNGVVVRTALNTTTARTITGTTNQISITNGDGVSGNPTIAIADNPVMPGTGSITIPTGTTAQRDTPTNGQLRYNSTLGYAEISDGNIYRPLGKIAQVITGNITQTTGTTILPYDATVPQITEGFQIWTANITPYYATSTILVMFNIFVEASGATTIPTVALFSTVTPTTTTLAASSAYTGIPNTPMNIAMTKSFTSGTTNAITITARVGPQNAATVYVNRGNSETFGGGINTSYTIMEIV